MAAPTSLPVTFKCGHTESVDLSSKPAGERKGYASWMARQQVCKRCFSKRTKTESEEYFRKLNADALANAEEFEKTHLLQRLQGTAKQIEWATRTRFQLLDATRQWVLDNEGNDTIFEDTILGAARLQTQARWWIDNRDSAPEDMQELLETADVPVNTENPY